METVGSVMNANLNSKSKYTPNSGGLPSKNWIRRYAAPIANTAMWTFRIERKTGMHRPVLPWTRLILLCLLLLTPATCLSWPAKIVSVTDGDTLVVFHGGRQKMVRLYGIDSPEKDQDFGRQAKALTAALVAGRTIAIEQKGIDHYGRVVGLVLIDGLSLNELIIQNGFAWVLRQNCKEKFCSSWISAEESAHSQRKGMWASQNITPPWEWRYQQRAAKTEVETAPAIVIGDEKPTPQAASRKHDRCDGRIYCSQMTSCQEATFFLRNCPGTKMDGNNDGVPCEKQWCR